MKALLRFNHKISFLKSFQQVELALSFPPYVSFPAIIVLFRFYALLGNAQMHNMDDVLHK